MYLLDLPLELIREILQAAVAGNGLDDASTYCTVCKLFLKEVPPLVYQLRLLETLPAGGWGFNIRSEFKNKRLYVSYLINWTADTAQRNEFHWMPALIRQVLHLVLTAVPDLQSRRDEIAATLCTAITDEHGETFAAYLISLAISNPIMMYYPLRRWNSSDEMNLLSVASLLGLLDLVTKLLEEGVRIRTAHFGHPLVNAVRAGHFEIVKALYFGRGNTQMVKSYGEAIKIAARRGDNQILRFLMEDWSIPEARKADVGNYSTPWPRLLLAIDSAAKSGHVHTIQYLLQFAGNRRLLARKNVVPYPELAPPKRPKDPVRFTSLDCIYSHILFPAIEHGHQPLITFTLSHGADPNHSYRLTSYLSHAVLHSRESIARLILQAGASPDNVGLSLGATALDETLLAIYREMAVAMPYWNLCRVPKVQYKPNEGRFWGRTPTWLWTRKESPQYVEVYDDVHFPKIANCIFEYFYRSQPWPIRSEKRTPSKLPPTGVSWGINDSTTTPQMLDVIQGTYDQEGRFEKGMPMRIALEKKLDGMVELLFEYEAGKPEVKKSKLRDMARLVIWHLSTGLLSRPK